MKILIAMVAAAFVFGSGLAASAGCGGCAKPAAKACGGGAMTNMLTKLSLTDEQATQMKDICAKYAQLERTPATASNCMAEVAQILTPEQAEKLKAVCQGSRQGCPMKPAAEAEKAE